ncbi:GNAT family N-acetyltransferase [Candidatus Parvarchaeota archaeon]|jgi:Acetyltransferases|nr:GNAT family N-acetyltransferase [Candidatus Parvarchaeota archaeon]
MKFTIKERVPFKTALAQKTKDREKIIRFIRKWIASDQFENRQSKKEELEWYTPSNLKKSSYLLFSADSADKNTLGVCSAEFYARNLIWIDWLITDSQYRRQGIGKAIIEELIEYARKNEVYNLLCDSLVSNKESRKFLKKLGFKKIGKIKKHWGKQDYYLWEYLL